MIPNDVASRYGSGIKFLHWLLLVLLVIQFILAFSFDTFPKGSAGKQWVVHTHESFGVLILISGVAFLLWRLSRPQPSLAALPAWQRGLARLVHVILYIAVVLQPLLGISMVMTSGHPVAFFGLDIPAFLPTSKAVGHTLGAAHEVVGWVILVAAGIHILGALYHYFIAGDTILQRMLPGYRGD